MMSSSYTRGLAAELYAALFLVLKGYRICRWRYKTPVGEIDLIAQRGKTVVFIEVKQRPDKATGLYAISDRMKSRISRAATHYMASGGAKADIYRFDAVIVSGFRIWHLDNAWLQTT